MTRNENNEQPLVAILEANRLRPNTINPDAFYKGSLVLAAMRFTRQIALEEGAKLGISRANEVVIADRELRAITNHIENEINLVSQAIALVKYGATLQVYFESQKPHQTLINSISILNAVIEEQHKFSIDLILPDNPALAEFNTEIRALATAIDRFVERKDLLGRPVNELEAAKPLKEWWKTHGTVELKRLINYLKQNIGSGRTEETALNNAIWKLCYSLWSGHPAQWSYIAKTLWEAIVSKSAKERTPDEKIVHAAWKQLEHRQRSEQIRYIWRSSGIMEDDEGKI